MNCPSRDLWGTPQDLFDKLNSQYKFTLDCCANKENRKCKKWSDDFEKLEVDQEGVLWHDTVWMNPPFSIAERMCEHFFKVVYTGVAIYRCDNMETKIWQQVILPNASWIFIPNKRINYERLEGDGARFPSALIGFRFKDSPEGVKGTTLDIRKVIENVW